MSVIWNSRVSVVQEFLIIFFKSMEKHLGLLQQSVIVKVSTVEGCLLSWFHCILNVRLHGCVC